MARDDERLLVILRKFESFDIDACCSQLDVVTKIGSGRMSFYRMFCLILAVSFSFSLCSTISLSSDECFVEMPRSSSKIFRQPEYCEICENVTAVSKVSNVSSSTFFDDYVRTARPVVLVAAALDWPAMRSFSFEFLKAAHERVDLNRDARRRCQFFPYRTEFKTLDDVFRMEPARARLEPGHAPWYVGWSNCARRAARLLRPHRRGPAPLAGRNQSEAVAPTWLFMGGPGRGAQLHVDDVGRPSWQAQLRGTKLWRLAPPPECLFRCAAAARLEVAVGPGDVVVVDTNRWYHQTHVLPDQISITIGSEFD